MNEITPLLFVLGTASLLLSIKISSAARSLQVRYGLLDGDALYSDLSGSGRVLRSERYHLSGKPDYIIKEGRNLIPVEVKSSLAEKPYRSHQLQLAAYGLIMEEIYRTYVPYGYIVYRNRRYRIELNDDLRAEVLSALDEMRRALIRGHAKRNHSQKARCLRCSFRRGCKQAL
ncbi:MAG: CRISPR-associated protein Cas4 [Methanothrix sp.]|jgi:CRISPR-associated exonuclease Cas4|uniref:CRISPR-associated protein Cas4 n=1 Tax=Methanothrix sp. TaxID=90426 RepID=UPI00247CE29D|nr:CRISPR-associated protein Cas4 [Methanothrix sp.]